MIISKHGCVDDYAAGWRKVNDRNFESWKKMLLDNSFFLHFTIRSPL